MPQPNQYRREDSYYSFIQRQTLEVPPASNVVVVPPGFSNQTVGPINFSLSADQAVKLVSLDGNVVGDNSGNLVVLASLIGVQPEATLAATPSANRQYSARLGNLVVLTGGIAIHENDPEWWFWNDFSEVGGSVGVFDISLSADFHNLGAVAINAFISLAACIEIYEKQKIGLSGQQRINRDAQGHFIE